MSVPPELPIQAPVKELEDLDRKHLIHAHHPGDRHERHIMVRGKGSTVWDIHGNEYVDAMGAVNWTAQVGHGRSELVDAAAKQMSDLAYFTAFEIYSHEPVIRLAARLAAFFAA